MRNDMTFKPSVPQTSSKKELYSQLAEQLPHLLEGETDFIANAANLSSFLYHMLPKLNWAGFYLLKGDELVLGPFQGLPACVRIKVGKGVCGTAARLGETVVVPNVHDFPDHIACDSASNSEIVVPLFKNGELLGVLDLDSPILARFDDEDARGLNDLAKIFIERTDSK